jgi:hypothetical protein
MCVFEITTPTAFEFPCTLWNGTTVVLEIFNEPLDDTLSFSF